jgi:hypothetical protein
MQRTTESMIRITWKKALRRAVLSGAVASIASAATLALCGKIERGTAPGPINGPSQWVWGRHAAHRREAAARYTLIGYLIHHMAATGWAILHEKYLRPARAPGSAFREVRNGAATAAVACLVDYRLTPKRLEPGFDAQLSRKSLVLVYAAFAIGLAITSRK